MGQGQERRGKRTSACVQRGRERQWPKHEHCASRPPLQRLVRRTLGYLSKSPGLLYSAQKQYVLVIARLRRDQINCVNFSAVLFVRWRTDDDFLYHSYA